MSIPPAKNDVSSLNNKIDFTLPPEDLFVDPGRDPAIAPLVAPDFFWRPLMPARILGFAASEHPEVNAKIENFIAWTRRHKTFARAVEFNTVPVRLERAAFKKSYVTADGRGLLSGASGMRLLNHYIWANEDSGFDAEARLVAYFDRCQARNTAPPLRQVTARAGDLPFAVECRNTFNYYHFMTESLCQLSTLDDVGGDRPVVMHFPNQPEKTRAFTRAFVDALYPEIAPKLRFERSPRSYGDGVLTAFNLTNAYYHWGDSAIGGVDGLIASDAIWKGRQATRASHGVLAMNAVDRNLVRLRARGLQAIAGQDFSHLPRRFYVGRLDGHARSRALKGEDELLEMLGLFGFERVAFETLSPLEQIAIMANAEVMISPHGAGFTNMVFANPDAVLIELGTLQTAMFRWGDFWRLANASGATYVSFFADFAKADPRAEPDFVEEGIVPVHLSRHGLAVVMSFLSALFGGLAHVPRRADLLRLARQMNEMGLPARALDLFRRHAGAEEGDADLSLCLADTCRALGDAAGELAALDSALRAAPERGHVAVRAVWCARKLGDDAALARALRFLGDRFPERLDSLVGERPWFRQFLPVALAAG